MKRKKNFLFHISGWSKQKKTFALKRISCKSLICLSKKKVDIEAFLSICWKSLFKKDQVGKK